MLSYDVIVVALVEWVVGEGVDLACCPRRRPS